MKTGSVPLALPRFPGARKRLPYFAEVCPIASSSRSKYSSTIPASSNDSISFLLCGIGLHLNKHRLPGEGCAICDYSAGKGENPPQIAPRRR